MFLMFVAEALAMVLATAVLNASFAESDKVPSTSVTLLRLSDVEIVSTD